MGLQDKLKLAEQLLDVWADYKQSYLAPRAFQAACEQFGLTKEKGQELIDLLMNQEIM